MKRTVRRHGGHAIRQVCLSVCARDATEWQEKKKIIQMRRNWDKESTRRETGDLFFGGAVDICRVYKIKRRCLHFAKCALHPRWRFPVFRSFDFASCFFFLFQLPRPIKSPSLGPRIKKKKKGKNECVYDKLCAVKRDKETDRYMGSFFPSMYIVCVCVCVCSGWILLILMSSLTYIESLLRWWDSRRAKERVRDKRRAVPASTKSLLV